MRETRNAGPLNPVSYPNRPVALERLVQFCAVGKAQGRQELSLPEEMSRAGNDRFKTNRESCLVKLSDAKEVSLNSSRARITHCEALTCDGP
jgi:hypothetical protein